MLKIKITKDLNNLKEGDVYDFGEFSTITIAGSNGCGKSTIVNALRSVICNNVDKKFNDTSLKPGYGMINNYKKHIKVETSFSNILYLSSQFDDPNSFMNAANAVSYIENGGFESRHKSKGESSDILLSKFLMDNLSNIIPGTLLILDEIDTGFDMIKQLEVIKLLKQICTVKCIHIICISHNELFMKYFGKLYDFKNKSYVEFEEYYDKQLEEYFSVNSL